jgi:hypothetical protein
MIYEIVQFINKYTCKIVGGFVPSYNIQSDFKHIFIAMGWGSKILSNLYYHRQMFTFVINQLIPLTDRRY